jgi:hypothetical protein
VAIKMRPQTRQFESVIFLIILFKIACSPFSSLFLHNTELLVPLARHIETVKPLHERDLSEGFGQVYLSFALAKKHPNAATE